MLPSIRCAPDNFGLHGVSRFDCIGASTRLRRRYMQILCGCCWTAEAICVSSAYMAAGCDAERAAVGPLCRAGTVSVRGARHSTQHGSVTAEASEVDMPQRTDWMRPLRYDVNHSSTPPIPYTSSGVATK